MLLIKKDYSVRTSHASESRYIQPVSEWSPFIIRHKYRKKLPEAYLLPGVASEGGYRDLKTYCLVKNRVVKGFFWHQITLILT